MGKLINIAGQRFGRLDVLNLVKIKNKTVWQCRCDCGNVIQIPRVKLMTGTRSCGCLKLEKNTTLDLSGKEFGRLKVLSLASKTSKGHYYWSCKCRCGNTTIVYGSSLVKGATKSCGCYQKECISKNSSKYNVTYGMTNTVEYKTW